MLFKIRAISELTLEHKVGEPTSQLKSTDYYLEVDKNTDGSHFIDKGGSPTPQGAKALTQCFIQGLVGNIHHCHGNKIWDSAEHLRYIIAELERGFIQIGETQIIKK